MRQTKKSTIPQESQNQCGQSAVEYMLLVAVVVAIVMVGLNNHIPRAFVSANIFMNSTSRGIMGPPSRCGDLTCSSFENNEKCCTDCGGC